MSACACGSFYSLMLLISALHCCCDTVLLAHHSVNSKKKKTQLALVCATDNSLSILLVVDTLLFNRFGMYLLIETSSVHTVVILQQCVISSSIMMVADLSVLVMIDSLDYGILKQGSVLIHSPIERCHTAAHFILKTMI
jgi:hypothetical protein